MLRKGDMGSLAPKQQEAADRIFDASERLVTLVNELLNVSRIESGTTKPSPQPTDMGKLIDDVVADTKALLDAKKQAFAYEKKKLPVMMIDPLLTREVIANLISNASKYSPDGTPITLAAERTDGDVLISVADRGMGIPIEQQKQMFSKFFRAENAAKSTIQGTGLGLYVCKQIVELSGGRIWFESEEGKGTTFFVRLPVAGAPAAAEEKKEAGGI
jgi:signal transduction histidine kinase